VDDLAAKLTISHLRLVVAIFEENSLVGAANRLHMTQPAVTKALHVVESLLDVALFDRTSSGMVATLYGQALVPQARIVLSQLAHAAQNIGDLCDGMIGRVVVGALPSPSAMLVPAAIVTLHSERPNLVVNVVEGTNEALVAALMRGDVELVVGRITDNLDPNELLQEELFRDEVCIVARAEHPLVGQVGVEFSDLVQADWILPTEATSLRRQITAAFRAKGLDPPVPIVESNSLLLTKSLLFQSDYLTLWPWQMVAWDVAEGRLGAVPLVFGHNRIAVGVTVRAKSQISPMAAHFIDALRKVSADVRRAASASRSRAEG
jgi:DNA-binding transcriptional LysR family regulator